MPNRQAIVDIENDMHRRFRAKCLFRALVRRVIENIYWLIEGVDEYEGVEDVKRRVEQAVRAKHKKQLLNINDKSLLTKFAEDRTPNEQRYLYRILGGLKCFKRYPNIVKKKLAAVTYYKYYGPNRVIVRQHQEAHALYFIVTGEVIVSQMIYDELLQKHMSVDLGVMTAGSMFGEVSLLHNIPRTATCTTLDHCELLALMKEDFKNVLQASVQKQWDEVKEAMSAFTYFDELDEVARREGCIIAKMKSYAANETILGDGVGVNNFVYFVLSGRCQMVESLRMNVTTRLGREYYTLYDPYVAEEESEEDFDKKWFAAYKDKTSRNTNESELVVKHASVSLQSAMKPGLIKSDRANKSQDSKSDEQCAKTTDGNQSESLHPSGEMRRQSVRMSVSINESTAQQQPSPSNLRTYFMQVCIFNPGSTFGFGENMRDRRIVALSPVDCMLLPKIWLLQRNTANIWSRIQHYLETKIPTKKKLFKEFVSARRWQNYRERVVADVVGRSNTVNFTTIHDVPYSVRMNEMLYR